MPNDKTTRTANGAGSIRQRSDGRWEAIVTVGIDPGTGKPIKKSLYAKTQKEVRQRMTKALAEIDTQAFVDPKRMTVGQWADTWLKDFTSHIRPNTRQGYETMIRLHIKPGLGAVPLQKLSAIHVQHFFNSLPEKLSPSTIAIVRVLLGGILNKAVELDLLRQNPVPKCKVPPVAPVDGVKRAISDEDLNRFMVCAEHDDCGLFFMTAVFSGLREGELLGLQWKNVDIPNCTITVDHQVQWRKKPRYHWVICDTKTVSSHRRIIVAQSLIDRLAEYHKKTHATAPDDFVFSRYGLSDPLSPSYLDYHFKRICERAGIIGVTIHDLRHTYATMSL